MFISKNNFFVNFITSLVAILTLNLMLICPLQAIQSNDDFVMLIIDNSGSMAEIYNGEPKLETAKKAIYQIIKDKSFDTVKMGLVELGGKCQVKELVKPGIYNRDDLENAINQVNSRPYLDAATPIAEAINKAARSIEKHKTSLHQTARIVLVSDGEANCLKEEEYPLTPCEIVGSLNQRNIKLDLTIIGYGVSQKKDQQFQCIASLSEDYQYYPVDNTEDFKKALRDKIEIPNTDSETSGQTINDILKNLTDFINSVEGVCTSILGLILAITAIYKALVNKQEHSTRDNEFDNEDSDDQGDQDEYYR